MMWNRDAGGTQSGDRCTSLWNSSGIDLLPATYSDSKFEVGSVAWAVTAPLAKSCEGIYQRSSLLKAPETRR